MELEKINGWRGIECPGYSVNKPWFEYNAEAGYYNRFQYGEAQIDQNTNAEQTGGEQIQNTNTNFALIELVAAKDAEEQTEQRMRSTYPWDGRNHRLDCG